LEPPLETTRSSAGWWVSEEVLEMIVLKELKVCRHDFHQNVEGHDKIVTVLEKKV
jgi:hypothetical protein